MTDDDKQNGAQSARAACATAEAPTSEAQLFGIAERWHMPLQRLEGESLRALADRLEHKVALLLLDLEEIATLDLEAEDAQ